MRTTMFHHRFVLVAVVIAVLLAGVWPAAAQSPNPPAVQTDCSFVLKAGVPFAWLRLAPSSSAAYTLTMQPGATVQSNTPATLQWDGVQWWIYVWPNFANVHGYYWVELGSLVSNCPQPNPPPPASGAANWQQGNVVRVKPGVYFVWFRAQPAPGSTPIHTVFSGADLVVMSGPSQDSYGQWWWHMSAPRTNVYGWVEQNSVNLISGTPTPVTPVPTDWRAGDIVRVRGTVPFSWLRSTPGSASSVLYTAASGQTLILQDGPLSDNVQNWWRVAIPYSGISGWVEAGSLELVQRS